MPATAVPSQVWADRIAPDVILAARNNSRVRWIPGLGLVLSWLVPMLVRWVIEYLIAKHGRTAGTMLGRWRDTLADLVKPGVLTGVDEVLALCRQPVTQFSEEMRVRALELGQGQSSPWRVE
jgi:hypothetical protein